MESHLCKSFLFCKLHDLAYLPWWVVGRIKYPKIVSFLGKLCLHGRGLLKSSSTAPHFVNRETGAPRNESAWLKATWERAVNLPYSFRPWPKAEWV